MKLIHCADVHLDSPLESVFPPDAARDYRRAVRSNFASLVAFADENGADALLIAGDLFDSGNTSEKTVRYVLELFRAHPDLSVFYLAGNHDGGGLSGRDDLPPNLHTFGQDWTYYRLGNLTLAGGTAPASISSCSTDRSRGAVRESTASPSAGSRTKTSTIWRWGTSTSTARQSWMTAAWRAIRAV